MRTTVTTLLYLQLLITAWTAAAVSQQKEENGNFAMHDMFDAMAARHSLAAAAAAGQGRELTHTIPQVATPRGCNYDFDHSAANTLVDLVKCPDWCGDGQDFVFTVTSTCDNEGCEAVADCVVHNCPGAAPCESPGDCPCSTVDTDAVCGAYCPTADGVDNQEEEKAASESPTDLPTQFPTASSTEETTNVVVEGGANERVYALEEEEEEVEVSATVEPTVLTVHDLSDEPVFEDGMSESEETAVPDVPGATEEPTAPVTIVSNISDYCYSSTTDLLVDVSSVDGVDNTTVFHLCPNTTYTIGTIDVNGTFISNGTAPLAARSNVHYVCGDDGKAANNCFLTGGEVQVLSSLSLYNEHVFNAAFHGITFHAATSTAALLSNGGDVTFDDCVFVEHANLGAVYLAWQPSTDIHNNVTETTNQTRRRKLFNTNDGNNVLDRIGNAIQQFQSEHSQSDNSVHQHGRKLEGHAAVDALRQQVSFYNTVFQDNEQGEFGNSSTTSTIGNSSTPFGIIATATGYNDLVVDSSLFVNNDFTENPDLGFAILVNRGSSLDIRDSSFVGNEFSGPAPILVHDAGTLVSFNNSGTLSTIDHACEFILQSEDDVGDEYNCTEFDNILMVLPESDEEVVQTEVPAPAAQPTKVPTEASISSPTVDESGATTATDTPVASPVGKKGKKEIKKNQVEGSTERSSTVVATTRTKSTKSTTKASKATTTTKAAKSTSTTTKTKSGKRLLRR